MTVSTRAGQDGADLYRREPWFDPNRQSRTPRMANLSRRVVGLIEGYETARGLRSRQRREQAQANLESLTDALVCDLVRRNLLTEGDGWLQISRSKKLLDKRSRYTPPYCNKHTVPVALDALSSPEVGLIDQRKGTRATDGRGGQTTVIRATDKLRAMAREDGIDLHDIGQQPGQELVILKNGKMPSQEDIERLGDPGDWIDYPETDEAARLRGEVRQINSHLDLADIVVDETVVPCDVDHHQRRLRRYYTRLGTDDTPAFDLGGRLFGGFWQNLSREQRAQAVYIDGEPVVGLDFSQMGLRLAYASVGLPLPEGDGYTIPGLEQHRKHIKKLVNSMLFPRSRHWALIPPSIRKHLPERFTDEYIVGEVQRMHPGLTEAGIWWTDIGHRIQNRESTIMVDILLRLGTRKIIGLPVHDGLMVPESRAEEARQVMLEVFQDHTGFPAEVSFE